MRIAPGEEILLSGPTVAPGGRDAVDGWLHTGDLGSVEDGRLRVSGRASDTIVSGGENVSPAEVEAVLEAHPDVLEAAVIGRSTRNGARPSRRSSSPVQARARRGGPARALRREPGVLQGAQADRADRRSAAAHAFWQAAAQRAAMSFDADTHRKRAAQLGRGGPRLDAPPELIRGARRARLALDGAGDRPSAGQRVLELAAGLGETGLLAAELVAPVGGVIISDQAEAMLEGAAPARAELGLTNVEFQVLNAEWIDLPVASVDAVLCRWGYMLMADPLRGALETRRVLRPGGRVALAVWDRDERNPWAQAPACGAASSTAWRRRPRRARLDLRAGRPQRVRELLAQLASRRCCRDLDVERRPTELR